MKPRIVLVDDDHPKFLSSFLGALRAQIGGVEILHYRCASSYIDALEGLAQNPPQAIVLDMLLPWREERDGSGPQEYIPMQGGLLLAEATRSVSQLSSVPIVFYSSAPGSIETRATSISQSFWLKKDSTDSNAARFIAAVVSVSVPVMPAPQAKENSLLEALELKPGAFGIKINLKRLFGKSDA